MKIKKKRSKKRARKYLGRQVRMHKGRQELQRRYDAARREYEENPCERTRAKYARWQKQVAFAQYAKNYNRIHPAGYRNPDVQ